MLFNYKLILLRPITKLTKFWMLGLCIQIQDISFKLRKTVCQENTTQRLVSSVKKDLMFRFFILLGLAIYNVVSRLRCEQVR